MWKNQLFKNVFKLKFYYIYSYDLFNKTVFFSFEKGLEDVKGYKYFF